MLLDKPAMLLLDDKQLEGTAGTLLLPVGVLDVRLNTLLALWALLDMGVVVVGWLTLLKLGIRCCC